jgi:hypothetical protein
MGSTILKKEIWRREEVLHQLSVGRCRKIRRDIIFPCLLSCSTQNFLYLTIRGKNDDISVENFRSHWCSLSNFLRMLLMVLNDTGNKKSLWTAVKGEVLAQPR